MRSWLLPATALVFILVTFEYALFLLRPSRGEAADKLAKPRQARMDRSPFRSYYLPLALLFVSAILLTLSALGQASVEARLTKLLLALTPVFGYLLLVRIRTWPR